PANRAVEVSRKTSRRTRLLIAGATVIALAAFAARWFGVHAPSRKTHQLEIAPAQAGQSPAQVEAQNAVAEGLASARGGVIANTSPEGATVTLGTVTAKSPATFKEVHLGKHALRIALDGYEPVEREVEVKENEFANVGLIPLQRSVGKLQLT